MSPATPDTDVLVTTATGQVGSNVARALVAGGTAVRVLVRPGGAERLPPEVRAAARIFEGALTDVDAVRAAADGATGVFLSLPPDGRTGDLSAFWLECTRTVATASTSLTHAVLLSSQGTAAEAPGLLGTFAEVERVLAAHIPNTRAMRAGAFMENLVPAAPALAAGVLPMPMRGDGPVGFVATADLGTFAAALLASPDWRGHRSLGVYGPEDLTPDEVAAILTRVLDRPIRHVRTTPDSMYRELLDAGMSADAARGATDLQEHVSSRAGEVIDPRTPEGTTPTDLAAFAREHLVPAVRAAG